MSNKLHDDEKVYEHPSYATIGISRIVGNVGKLFGSSLENHYSSIRIRIHESECIHSLGHDRYYPKKEIIEIELSAVQFAEFVTTSNAGVGVPCTIRRMHGKRVEDPPTDVMAEATKIRETFQERMKELANELKTKRKRVDELLAQKVLKVDDRKELASLMHQVMQEVQDNAPFMASQFEEAAERMVGAAKAEVDAFVTHHIMAEGYKSLVSKLEEEKSPQQLPESTE